MNPTIRNCGYILLAGYKNITALTNDQTTSIWQKFMKERAGMPERFGNRYFSVSQYPSDYFNYFDPSKEYMKWACMETPGNAPDTMETLEIMDGTYAVFIHHGPAAFAFKTFHYIFNDWIPSSGFEIDQRPHFEIMPEGYKPDDPNATEEVWIPVRKKIE